MSMIVLEGSLLRPLELTLTAKGKEDLGGGSSTTPAQSSLPGGTSPEIAKYYRLTRPHWPAHAVITLSL